VALVSVDRMLYQVRVGDYMGQNNGRVVKIEEGRIELREVVQDASGEWVERPASLQTQEGAR
jgi:type IV pilus assembly protein PilP